MGDIRQNDYQSATKICLFEAPTVDGLVGHLGGFPDLEGGTVHPHDQIDWFQGSVLPGNDVLRHLFGYP